MSLIYDTMKVCFDYHRHRGNFAPEIIMDGPFDVQNAAQRMAMFSDGRRHVRVYWGRHDEGRDYVDRCHIADELVKRGFRELQDNNPFLNRDAAIIPPIANLFVDDEEEDLPDCYEDNDVEINPS